MSLGFFWDGLCELLILEAFWENKINGFLDPY